MPDREMRYSIMGVEYGSANEVELVRVNSNPQAVLNGLKQKSLTIRNGDKRVQIPKYSWLRIIDHGERDG